LLLDILTTRIFHLRTCHRVPPCFRPCQSDASPAECPLRRRRTRYDEEHCAPGSCRTLSSQPQLTFRKPRLKSNPTCVRISVQVRVSTGGDFGVQIPAPSKVRNFFKPCVGTVTLTINFDENVFITVRQLHTFLHIYWLLKSNGEFQSAEVLYSAKRSHSIQRK